MVSISIIVPVLNEAAIIRDFLEHLRVKAPSCEVVVVDGGSTDGTREIARQFADAVLEAPRGRGSQMNAGAVIARGEVFWFLHADCRIPSNAVLEIQAKLSDPVFVGGCFRLRIVPRRWIYRVRDAVGNLLVSLGGIALGDRGHFCRRDVFATIGGFTNPPILEDADFYRRLQGAGRTRQLHFAVETSSRRYEALGAIRTSLLYAVIVMLYCAGMHIEDLTELYRWCLRRYSPT